MVLNKRITRENIGETFDAFDVFRRGELRASQLIDVASVFFHFLDCSPQNLFAEFATHPLMKRDDAIELIYSHICGTATNNEALNMYEVFTNEDQAGPQDSIEVVGTRFGPNANYGSHPDGYKLDPLLLSIASRCMGEKKTSKRVADAALFVQNASQVLHPTRASEESLSREEWEDLYMASTLLSPGVNKKILKALRQSAESKVEESHQEPGQVQTSDQ
jgi:hypothetical protein